MLLHSSMAQHCQRCRSALYNLATQGPAHIALAVRAQCFAKLNCNKHNKSLGVELGVKVAPTFQLYKNSVKVAEMTGAKIDALKELVASHK